MPLGAEVLAGFWVVMGLAVIAGGFARPKSNSRFLMSEMGRKRTLVYVRNGWKADLSLASVSLLVLRLESLECGTKMLHTFS